MSYLSRHQRRKRLRLEVLEARRLLATLNVTSAEDVVDLNPGDGICEISLAGPCTLRAAIQEANALGSGESPHQINVPVGTYVLSIPGQDESLSRSGDLDVNTDMVLSGIGAGEVIVDANGMDRVFDVRIGEVVIERMTIRGGLVIDTEASVESSGGGIRNEGDLTIRNSTITGNVAPLGAGIANYNGSVEIFRSVISGNGNLTTERGGGVANDSNYDPASLQITESTITGNRADTGGGIDNQSYDSVATTTIIRSTVSGNTADQGAGVSNRSTIAYEENSSAVMTVLTSTISGNVANSQGGGIQNVADAGSSARLDISGSTITANAAASVNGGGIFDSDSGARTTIRSSIVSGNSAGGQGPDIASPAATATFSLIQSSDGHSIAGGSDNNLVGTDPLLGELADNGGPTLTHTLLENSPAIDQGSNADLFFSDQRGNGFVRTVDNSVIDNAGDGTDIGAVEVGQVGATLDFGDAPDAIAVDGVMRNYPTLLNKDGARHLVVEGGPYLGLIAADVEQDGQPTPSASGDDAAFDDDEDSITDDDSTTGDAIVLTPGEALSGLSISHDGGVDGGLLSGWVDFNLDGDWNDLGEQILTDVPIDAGPSTTTLQNIVVPSGLVSGTTFIRLRISSTGGLTPSGPASDGEVEDYVATIGVPADRSADLELTATTSQPELTVGEEVTFTITLNNRGPDAASGVTVTDLLPAGTTFVRSALTQGNYDSGTGIWTLGVVEANAAATLNLVATAIASGTINHVAEVTTSDQQDPDSTPGNGIESEDDQSSLAIVVASPVADLSLQMTVDDANPIVGQNVTFTITVSNAGPELATGVEVTDDLPGDLTFVSTSPSQGSFDDLSGVWIVGNLAPLSSATLTLVATAQSTETITNTAEVTAADQADSDSTPDNSEANEDDQASIDLGTCLVAEPLHVGMNRLTFSCATADSFSAFVRGPSSGTTDFDRYNTTVDINGAEIFATSIADPSGLAVAYINIGESEVGDTVFIQAFELIPGSRKSNTLSLEVIESDTAAIFLDVNNDSAVTTLDALLVINELSGTSSFDGESTIGQSDTGTGQRSQADTNGDRKVTALDALLIINHLSQSQNQSMQGEVVTGNALESTNAAASRPDHRVDAEAVHTSMPKPLPASLAIVQTLSGSDPNSLDDSEFGEDDVTALMDSFDSITIAEFWQLDAVCRNSVTSPARFAIDRIGM